MNHHHFHSIDSTNTWAKKNAATFSRKEITLITADTQTAGRGRFHRSWSSPPDQNIYATFCFFMDGYSASLGNIPQILAISTAETLKHFGFQPNLKWPNDILLSDKKVAGILCETTSVPDALCIVLGIGLNVNMTKDYLVEISRPATSLYMESGRLFDRQAILEELQKRFQKDIASFLLSGFHVFKEQYQQLLSISGLIRFHDADRVCEGTFHSLAEDGSLNLLLEGNVVRNFKAGEIG